MKDENGEQRQDNKIEVKMWLQKEEERQWIRKAKIKRNRKGRKRRGEQGEGAESQDKEEKI